MAIRTTSGICRSWCSAPATAGSKAVGTCRYPKDTPMTNMYLAVAGQARASGGAVWRQHREARSAVCVARMRGSGSAREGVHDGWNQRSRRLGVGVDALGRQYSRRRRRSAAAGGGQERQLSCGRAFSHRSRAQRSMRPNLMERPRWRGQPTGTTWRRQIFWFAPAPIQTWPTPTALRLSHWPASIGAPPWSRPS